MNRNVHSTGYTLCVGVGACYEILVVERGDHNYP